MNRHTIEMLHDVTTHDAMRRLEFLIALAIGIVVLHGLLYHFPF